MKKLVVFGIMSVLFSACENRDGGEPNISEQPILDASPSVPTPTKTTTLQKLTYKIGPFDLPAGQQAETMWESPGTIDFQAEEPLWVVSFEPKIESESGEELDDGLLNLAVIANGGEKNPLCHDKEVANPFIAATSVTKSIELPDGQGYPVLPEDKLHAKVILQNPGLQEYKNVYFKFTITAIPMKAAKNIEDVAPLLLNVDPCDYTPIPVAPKEFVKKHVSFKVPEDGLLTKAYGLLQNYGVKIALSAKGQPLWEASAELSSEHSIVSLPVFEDPAGLPLKAGDELSLEVAYDNRSESWQNGSIGAVMAYVTRAKKAMTATDVQKSMLK